MCCSLFYSLHFHQQFFVTLNNRCKNLQGSLYQTLVFEQQSYQGRLLLYHWVLLSTSLALQCPKINKRSFQPVFTSSPELIVTQQLFPFYTQRKVIVCLKLANLRRNIRSGSVSFCLFSKMQDKIILHHTR